MKTTVVPAQITSIEDTIAGNLTLTQVVLIVSPVFITAFIFISFPPFLHVSLYKIILIVFLAVPFFLLALRIRGKIMLKWLIILSSYKLRPRLYLLSCKSCVCKTETIFDSSEHEPLMRQAESQTVPLTFKELMQLHSLLATKKVQYCTDGKGQISAVIKTKEF